MKIPNCKLYGNGSYSRYASYLAELGPIFLFLSIILVNMIEISLMCPNHGLL